MARKAKKQAVQSEAPQSSYDEFVDDADVLDDDIEVVDENAPASDIKLRDWRDVEKLKEERLLRQLVDDDLDIDDL